MDPISIRTDQLPLVQEIGYLTDPLGEIIHPDRTFLTIDVFLFVIEGAIEVVEEDVAVTVTAGEYLFLKAGLRHFGRKPFQQGTRWYYLHWFSQETASLEDYPIEAASFFTTKASYNKKLSFERQGIVTQPQWLIQTFKQILKQTEATRLQQSIAVFDMLYHFYLQQREPIKPRNQQIVAQVLRLIEDKPKQLSSQMIAKALHLNYSYISTVFKETTGKTIRQVRLEKQVAQAIDYFHQTDLNVSEVSEKLNFPNPYYFSRVFKQVTGMNPRDYLSGRYHKRNKDNS